MFFSPLIFTNGNDTNHSVSAACMRSIRWHAYYTADANVDEYISPMNDRNEAEITFDFVLNINHLLLLDAINNVVSRSESKYQPYKSSRKAKIKTNVVLIALTIFLR